MEIAQSYLEKFQPAPAKPRSEREEIVGKFLTSLNPPRIKSGYGPYCYAHLSSKFKGLTDHDLHVFYRQCENANSFSRYFHWALKPKAAH